MSTVLVLNATYEPMSYTRLQRAVAMVTRGDAVVEESVPGKILRHKRGEMPWPKTLRLLRYIKVTMDFRPAGWSKAGVLKRDGYTCAYCGRTAKTVDHIVPLSKGGGRTDWLNTVAACDGCNGRKRDRTPQQAKMELRFTPTVPMATKVRVAVSRPRRS